VSSGDYFVYELEARGKSINNFKFYKRGKALYATKELAESDIASFRLLCCSEENFDAAENEGLSIEIIERKVKIK